MKKEAGDDLFILEYPLALCLLCMERINIAFTIYLLLCRHWASLSFKYWTGLMNSKYSLGLSTITSLMSFLRSNKLWIRGSRTTQTDVGRSWDCCSERVEFQRSNSYPPCYSRNFPCLWTGAIPRIWCNFQVSLEDKTVLPCDALGTFQFLWS